MLHYTVIQHPHWACHQYGQSGGTQGWLGVKKMSILPAGYILQSKIIGFCDLLGTVIVPVSKKLSVDKKIQILDIFTSTL